MKPVVLDLFGCEGGATAGYQRGGAQVIAVDLDENRLKYNPAEVKIVANAFDVLDHLFFGGTITTPDGRRVGASDITLVHGSPPCQGYTRGNAGKETSWPKLIPQLREAFKRLGVPYVIENVEDAACDMASPTALCGCMFDLKAADADGQILHMQRLRLFETSWDLQAPRPCDHSAHEWVAGSYGGSRKAKRFEGETLAEVAPRDRHEARYVRKGGYVPRSKAVVADLLGIDHTTTWRGLHESIPPAYARYVFESLTEDA